MADGLFLSLRCRSVWAGPLPVGPQEFLQRLPAELERFRGSGASLVEFKTEVCSLDQRYCDRRIWEHVAGCIRNSGLAGATVHLPAAWVDLAALDREVWEGSVRSVEAALRATAPLKPKLAAVHPASDATAKWIRALPEADRRVAMQLGAQRMIDGLRRLRELPEAEPLALENLEGAGCEVITSVAEQADVGVCLDVGHVVSNGEELVRALDAVTRRLRGIHLHDAMPPTVVGGKGKAHLSLGAGVLDLEILLTELRDRRFSGPIVLEVKGEFAKSADHLLATARSIL